MLAATTDEDATPSPTAAQAGRMTLTRRVAVLMALLMLLAFGGALAIQTGIARQLLQQQLQTRNQDAAAAMALAWAPLQDDARALLAAATDAFESGRYKLIRVQDGQGRAPALLRQQSDLPKARAPAWFVALLPVAAAPGRAALDDGEVTVETPPAWAQDALWDGAVQTATWLGALALVAALLAAWALRGWQQPLRAAMAQAQGLEEGRFVEAAEPRPAELRALTRSMNATVRRLRETYAAQASQVALLQRQAQLDAVTGLPLRPPFIGQLQQRLAEPGGPGAALILVRVLHLDTLNPRLGHEATDHLLAAIGSVLLTYVDRVSGAFAGRLNGSDFALCLPAPGVAQETTESLRLALAAAPAVRSGGAEIVLGGVDSLRDTSGGAALAAADAALAHAEAASDAGASPAVEQHDDIAAHAGGARAWREQIAVALAEGRTRLAEFSVVDRHGGVLHLECPLRVQLSPGDDYQAASSWLALARRSRLMPQVDLAALDLALQAIAADGRARAVHTSPVSLTSPGFVAAMTQQLLAAPAAARHLAIECMEGQRPGSNAPLAEAAATWRLRGVRIGIEHAGASPHQLPGLKAAGIDYVKVDARHLRGAAADDAVRGYAQSLVALIHGLGLTAIAQGVDDAADLAVLWALGFDGATGPAVRPAQPLS